MRLTQDEKVFMDVLKTHYCSDEAKQCAVFKVNDLIEDEAVAFSEKEIKSFVMTLFDKGLLSGLSGPDDEQDDYPFIPYDLDLTVTWKDL